MTESFFNIHVRMDLITRVTHVYRFEKKNSVITVWARLKSKMQRHQ